MIGEMLTTHSLLVKIFLGFLVIGIFLPFIYGKDMRSFKKMSFIYTMIFQALTTMIAFSGLIPLFTGEGMNFSIPIAIMIAVWVIMMYLEIKKHKNIKVAPMQDEQKFMMLKGKFVKISIAQVILVALMVIIMILKSKGIIF
jgi:archaellum biogenesis protein FlaJ (TadC family)